MPNIRSQVLTEDGISLVASDGRSITITKSDVLAHYQTETGSAATRKANTIQWAKNLIVSTLGQEQIDITQLVLDADMTLGKFSKLEIW
jgi:hypothetical protein